MTAAPSPEAQRVAREIVAGIVWPKVSDSSCVPWDHAMDCPCPANDADELAGEIAPEIAARLAPIIERAEKAEDERDNLREQIDLTRLSADGTATRLRSERDELRAWRDEWRRCALEQETQRIAREQEVNELIQQRDAAEAALRDVQAWRGTRDRPLDAIERAAKMFYRETGFLAPGKAYPLGMKYDDKKRRAAWDEWVERKNAELDAKIAAVLAAADAREKKEDSNG